VGPTGLHPDYEKSKFQSQIENRYKRILPTVPFTLNRLMQSADFRTCFEHLRAQGWLDWHILLAIANIRANYLYGALMTYPPTKEKKNAFRMKFEQQEVNTDAIVPPEEFSEEKMKNALQIAQLTTVGTWGFEVRQSTPNFAAIGAFLKRFRYWEDDVPHEPFFLAPRDTVD
jgi:hypothetical protein